MAKGTRFKELEKMVLGIDQHQELHEKRVKDKQRALNVFNLKIDMFLEVVNKARLDRQNGIV